MVPNLARAVASISWVSATSFSRDGWAPRVGTVESSGCVHAPGEEFKDGLMPR